MRQTYPRLADVIGFLPADKVVDVAKAVLTIHRDFGDRTNRKHARLKYVVAERGVDWTRAELEQRAGFKLEAAKPYQFTTMSDIYGWNKATDGKWFLTLFVLTGRVKDVEGHKMKTALRAVSEKFHGPGIPLVREPKPDSRQRRGSGQGGHHGPATFARREDGKTGECFAFGGHGLSVAANLRPRPRGIRAHVARLD